ncbi:MAG TPA: rod shape-determining protein MreD [Dehalococcoidia bacterium]|jgi:rod shape-determining protein MreD|nr:rod shape-determining protein MreD [Dehalococcoidia bacterium]
MRYAVAFVLAWFIAVANVSALAYVKVLGVTPDFVLIFAACWAVIRNEEEALVVVPVCGLLRDLLSSDPTGTAILGFAPIVLFAALARSQPIDSDFPPAVAVVAAGTLVFAIVQTGVLGLTGQSIDVWQVAFRVIVPAVVINALFTPILYLPVRWLSPRRALAMQGGRRLTAPLT